MTAVEPRAPAVHAKLDGAVAALATLETEVAELALAAAENRPGAAGKLTQHRGKIELAKQHVEELRAALKLAVRIDRENEAACAARMRDEQFADFKAAMLARQKAMATVLEAAATMAKAYGAYSEATLAAQIAVPTGTAVPVMMIGPEGLLGAAFGPCERLIESELYRCAPLRADGIGRFVIPLAKPTAEMFRLQPEAIPAGIDELRAADQAIVAEIEKQVAALDQRAMAAASAVKEAA
jgi:hypothetical protein